MDVNGTTTTNTIMEEYYGYYGIAQSVTLLTRIPVACTYME